jgi:hypothetical protein
MDSQRETRRAAIRQECAKRNVQITPYGQALWLEGIGVNIVANDLANVTPSDLLPARIANRR